MVVEISGCEAVAKFWLESEPAIASNYALSSSELKELLGIAIENKQKIRRFWDEHFSK